MTDNIKEKNNALLSGKVKPSQKEYIEEAIVGENNKKLEFNEKIGLLIRAYKEMKRREEENKVQISSKLAKINQYNDSINEIIKSIALDSEHLVELNNEGISDRIEELKSLNEINQSLIGKNNELT